MAIPLDYRKVPYETDVQVLLYENNQNENYALHWHTAVEIIMPVRDAYEVSFLRKNFTLREHDIFIVPSRELHGIRVPPSAEEGRRLILQFEPALLYSLPGFSGAISGLHNLNLITPEETPNIYETAHSLLWAIYDEFIRGGGERKKKDVLWNMATYAKIIELYVLLARYYPSGTDQSDNNKTGKYQEHIARMNMVFEFIEEHISEELTLDSVAEIAHFSKFYFARVFKEFTSLSFYRYLQQKRVKKAETLLSNPQLSISDIAMDAGFESITTFNRVFKEQKHYTPSEYKKMYIRQP
jgi:AraC-like DNA-binding protein